MLLRSKCCLETEGFFLSRAALAQRDIFCCESYGEISPIVHLKAIFLPVKSAGVGFRLASFSDPNTTNLESTISPVSTK
jgi:hypothetical protein